jgi:hypothetical protein
LGAHRPAGKTTYTFKKLNACWLAKKTGRTTAQTTRTYAGKATRIKKPMLAKAIFWQAAKVDKSGGRTAGQALKPKMTR